jgi:hypothetical protein
MGISPETQEVPHPDFVSRIVLGSEFVRWFELERAAELVSEE